MRIGVDAGGTFTDFLVLHDDGKLETFKLRSNPRAPAKVILAGLEKCLVEQTGRSAEIIHGSTVATNALLERKGARTALVTTEGFENVIHIGRQNRSQLYHLTPPLPRPLVPRSLCFGVRERMYFGGEVAARPSAASLKKLKERLRRLGVESIAICFLHSYQNAENEKAAAKLLAGDAYLCCSYEACPEFREYERSSTTLINAYVGPLMDAYLEELERGVRRHGRHSVTVMQSNGGFITASEARRHAVRTILSGPAGGVVGALEMARLSGFQRILGFDMGGTSTDVSLSDGKPRETTEASVDGFPIRVPVLDIHTVGAGGGSLARVDEGGLLRVGPESAGADPGPACYGVGDQPTVTDAHVVLGRIAAHQFLGGEMAIDTERAGAAVDTIARALGLSRVAAAEGILRVADANMERAIRVVSVERGHDPRDFALVAFGGCGGLHACAIAEDLGIRTVLVPEHAGALSALGMLLADRVRDYAAGVLGSAGIVEQVSNLRPIFNRPGFDASVEPAGRSASATTSEIEKRFRALERQAHKDCRGALIERLADIRYAGQSYELTVPWNPSDPAAPFHKEHQRTYGYADPARPIQLVTIRVRARIPVAKPALHRNHRRVAQVSHAFRGRPAAFSAKRPDLSDRRKVRIAGRWFELPVYTREQVSLKKTKGPVLVLDYGSTTLVAPGWYFGVDKFANLTIGR